MNSSADLPMLSNSLVQLFVDCAVQEVGADELQAILTEAQLPPAAIERAHLVQLDGVEAARLYASIQQALRLYYGRGARGTLLRIGAGMWNRKVEHSNLLEKAELEIVRRLPVPARRRRVLELLAGAMQEGGGSASVHSLDLDLVLVDHSGAATVNQTSSEPICFVTLGLIQAALFWAAGQEADMEEIACKAIGAPACEFRIKPGAAIR